MPRIRYAAGRGRVLRTASVILDVMPSILYWELLDLNKKYRMQDMIWALLVADRYHPMKKRYKIEHLWHTVEPKIQAWIMKRWAKYLYITRGGKLLIIRPGV